MNKSNDRKTIIIFIAIGVVLFSIFGFKFYNDFLSDNNSNKQISSIKSYGYSLNANDTSIYKSKYKELESVLNSSEINYSEYARLISELFVIDTFTLDNKLASTDIGGLEFLHEDIKENFQDNMGSTLYRNIENNLDGNRKQELPIVKEITKSEVFETTYKYNDKEYNSYLVTLSWNYEKDMKYQNTIKLTVINNNNKLFIVKGE